MYTPEHLTAGLPVEIWCNIFGRLQTLDQLQFRIVNSVFYYISCTSTEAIRIMPPVLSNNYLNRLDVSPIQKFPYLKKLVLSNLKLDNSFGIDNMCRLLWLEFYKCSFICDDIFNQISKLDSLEVLSLCSSTLLKTGNGLLSLCRLTKLKSLDVSFTRIDNKVFHLIKNMNELTSLNLNGCLELVDKIDMWEASKQLSVHTNLTSLHWSTCPSPFLINIIATKLINLRNLDLSVSCLGDQLPTIAQNMKKLERLYLAQAISTFHPNPFKDLKNLKALDLSLCGWVENQVHNIHVMKELVELSLSIISLDTLDISFVCELKNLKELSLSYSYSTPGCIDKIVQLISLIGINLKLYHISKSLINQTPYFNLRQCSIFNNGRAVAPIFQNTIAS